MKKPDCSRSDDLYKEIQDVMADAFGAGHMEYAEPTQDPFANSDSDSSCEPLDVDTADPFADSDSSCQPQDVANTVEDPFADLDSDSSCDVGADTTEDPFAESSGADTGYSSLEYSDIDDEYSC